MILDALDLLGILWLATLGWADRHVEVCWLATFGAVWNGFALTMIWFERRKRNRIMEGK